MRVNVLKPEVIEKMLDELIHKEDKNTRFVEMVVTGEVVKVKGGLEFHIALKNPQELIEAQTAIIPLVKGSTLLLDGLFTEFTIS